jgi:hypothetical protein
MLCSLELSQQVKSSIPMHWIESDWTATADIARDITGDELFNALQNLSFTVITLLAPLTRAWTGNWQERSACRS